MRFWWFANLHLVALGHSRDENAIGSRQLTSQIYDDPFHIKRSLHYTHLNSYKGKWICVEFMLQHNTPGKADGEQAFWIDGKPVGHWKGINWRTSPTLWANSLTLESYVTDLWTKNPVNTVFFDNLVIAKNYIGPVE